MDGILLQDDIYDLFLSKLVTNQYVSTKQNHPSVVVEIAECLTFVEGKNIIFSGKEIYISVYFLTDHGKLITINVLNIAEYALSPIKLKKPTVCTIYEEANTVFLFF
ncbi:MAG: hypothetical protein ABI045_04875 [Flavobacteriales bacterium]